MDKRLPNREKIHEVCVSVDGYLADLLAESIEYNRSYDKLEAKYGVIVISRNCFYRKRRKAERILRQQEKGEE